MIAASSRAAGVEAHTIVRDQLTTEHEQEAIRKVSRSCERFLYEKGHAAAAHEWCFVAATVISQLGQTGRVTAV